VGLFGPDSVPPNQLLFKNNIATGKSAHVLPPDRPLQCHQLEPSKLKNLTHDEEILYYFFTGRLLLTAFREQHHDQRPGPRER
jgi:hypothetical protein